MKHLKHLDISRQILGTPKWDRQGTLYTYILIIIIINTIKGLLCNTQGLGWAERAINYLSSQPPSTVQKCLSVYSFLFFFQFCNYLLFVFSLSSTISLSLMINRIVGLNQECLLTSYNKVTSWRITFFWPRQNTDRDHCHDHNEHF